QSAIRNLLAIRNLVALDGDLSSLRHSLLGVEHEVEDGLLEQLLVERDRRQVSRQIALDRDIGLTSGRREEINHLLDDAGQVRLDKVEVLNAGETQEVVGDLDQPDALVLQPLDALQGTALPL